MSLGTNLVKKRVRMLATERMIKALGKDRALAILAEIDAKAPRKVMELNNSKLSSEEHATLYKWTKMTSWQEMALNGKVKGYQAQSNYARLAYRYLRYNLKK